MQCAMITGVGVTMDNMLYIIAGLVLILLVVGLVLRKNKAQKSSPQRFAKSERNTATSTPAQVNKAEDKFNPIMIAQRFMDQQRYDKAIETLNRGLREKPNDGDLSLKLLSIYATINQPENFNKVYDGINTQGDAKSIALADELKNLFFEEPNQVLAQETPVEDSSSFGSIDFDLPTSQSNSNNDTLSSEPIVSPTLSDDFQEVTSTNSSVEDSFDLTLNDLESGFNETAVTSTAPAALNVTEETPITDTATADSELIDFDFNFDSPEETSTSTEPSIDSATSDNIAEEKSIDNEAFVLDFEDLASDVDQNTEETLVEEMVVDAFEQDTEEDFALSLDSIDTPDDIEASLEIEEAVFEGNSDNFVLQDSSFEEPSLEEALFEETVLEELKSESSDSEMEGLEEDKAEEHLFNDTNLQEMFINGFDATPTDTSLFDDNSIIDNELAVDSLTAASPVDIETDIVTNEVGETPETAEDFSSRFAADFDFVKSLDSNQVTLDLAGQYLQLGEYDSAKRLLNEVIAHGDSEQQSQAQILLERTA